jgi:purine nucleosidase
MTEQPESEIINHPARIHLDTDFAGDPDDACALAMLLGCEGVEISGITTNLDHDGSRADAVRYMLELADRADIPVASGSKASWTTGEIYDSTVGDPRHWPTEMNRSSPGSRQNTALHLLETSVEEGATIVAIGALTNLAQLAKHNEAALRETRVVAMGGWIDPPASELPQWGPEMDWNIQVDTLAATTILGKTNLTFASFPATMKAQLRSAHLERLRAAGPIGRLLAAQSEAHRDDNNLTYLAANYEGIADDIVNFHWDPATCGVAVGWGVATVEAMQLRAELGNDQVLRFHRDPAGHAVRVVTDINPDAFNERWIRAIERIDGRTRS